MIDDNVILRMVQTGVVSAVDSANRKARVIFNDSGMVSDWLYILHTGGGVNISSGGEHSHTVTASGNVTVAHDGGELTGQVTVSGTTGENGSHTHNGNITQWIPSVNDIVLVLYIPMEDSDGFILGGV